MRGQLKRMEPGKQSFPETLWAMEYYSAIKKNTFESVLVRWMKLEPIVQSEVRHKGRQMVGGEKEQV